MVLEHYTLQDLHLFLQFHHPIWIDCLSKSSQKAHTVQALLYRGSATDARYDCAGDMHTVPAIFRPRPIEIDRCIPSSYCLDSIMNAS